MRLYNINRQVLQLSVLPTQRVTQQTRKSVCLGKNPKYSLLRFPEVGGPRGLVTARNTRPDWLSELEGRPLP